MGSDMMDVEQLAAYLRRDARDTARAVAPLRKADDAVELDTTRLDIEQAVAAAIEIVERARKTSR